jgi:cell division transport system permease protein
MLGLRGGAIGLGLALATLLGLQQFARGVEVPLMGVLGLAPTTWVVLVVLPLAASLVATLTARATVLRTLTRLP